MPTKKKIAILGAGPSGLTAAFGMSATQELRDQYDITIYQVGWRAGGKCGTGRAGPTNRIQQNGTHYLFGCYDNCFATVKTAFDELKQKGIEWFGPYEKAFLPRDLLAFKQFFRGKYETWPVVLPVNGAEPGTSDGLLRPVEYVSMALQFLVEMVLGKTVLQGLAPQSPMAPKRPFLLRALYAILSPVWWIFAYAVSALVFGLWKTSVALLRALGDEGLEGIVWIFRLWRRVTRALLGGMSHWSLGANRLFALIDFSCAAGIGLIRDGVLGPKGLGAIEGVEFRDWLRTHGALEDTLYAPFVTTWYDAVAAYEFGDPHRPNMSAGVSVLAIAKATCTYKGHFAYQMRAEIGDSFIAPIFQCLRERGVKIRFFHRVWDIVPNAGNEIDEVLVERQVDLKSGDPDSYQPFIEVAGLHAWPAGPLWDQIQQPAPAGPNDIESYYTTWRGKQYTLKKGVDFDTLILALPLDTFRTYCTKLVGRNHAWRAMVENLHAVETQSIRLWFGPSLAQLGWTLGTPILSAYTKPFSTWEDNGELVTVETWPPAHQPKAMATVFGALPAPSIAPSYEDVEYPCTQLGTAQANALKFMENDIGPLWYGAASPPDPLGVEWSKLVDLSNGTGAARMQSQYVRANAGPIERYTMARADTSKYRLATDESGYTNLFLAGDWIQNHFLIGSVEGAMMGGLQASRAICGSPKRIPGENTRL